MLTGSVVAVSLLALVVVFAVYFSVRGPARAGLASVGLTAALVGPVTGIGASSYVLIQIFSQMARGSGDSVAKAVLAGVAEAVLPTRVGCVAAALTLVIASALGWIGRGRPAPLRPASAGRVAVLALPAVLAFLLVGGAHEYARRTRNLVIEVMSAPGPARESAAGQGAEAAEDAPHATAGSIAETSRRLSLGVMAGVFGVPFLLLVLSAFAAAAAILAWRVEVPTAFAVASSAWMLLQAALWIAALLLWRTPGVS